MLAKSCAKLFKVTTEQLVIDLESCDTYYIKILDRKTNTMVKSSNTTMQMRIAFNSVTPYKVRRRASIRQKATFKSWVYRNKENYFVLYRITRISEFSSTDFVWNFPKNLN